MTDAAPSLNRWLEWQTSAITANTAEAEPTKPSKPGSVGFDGSASVVLPKIEPDSKSDIGPPAGSIELDCVVATERPMSWAAWKASELNRLFQDQGVLGQPGKITPEAVLHGEQANRFVEKRKSGEGKT